MQPTNRSKLRRVYALIFVLLLLIIFGAWQFYQASHFRVVSTDPSTHNFANVSPFFKVNFNRSLSEQGLSVSSTPSIISSYTVSGKTLIINLSSTLNTDQNYTININHAADTKGEVLSDLFFRFTPKYVNAQDLSSEQKTAILKQQTVHPPSKTYIAFSGITNMISYGLTQSQVNALENAYFKFNQTAKSINIDPDSISPVPHNPSSASTSDAINFNSSVDGKKYSSKVVYWGLTMIRLYLYSSSGATVFDSGNVSG